MLKNLVIHPLLFSLTPILLVFKYSIHEVPLVSTFWPLIFSFLIALGLWVILRFFVGGKKSGLIVSLLVMLFVIYGYLHTFMMNTDSEFSFIGRNMIMGTIFLVLLVFLRRRSTGLFPYNDKYTCISDDWNYNYNHIQLL